jgi:cytochrome c peroxidase
MIARRSRFVALPALLLTLAPLAILTTRAAAQPFLPQLDVHHDPSGFFATFQPAGPSSISSESNPFFESLGTNGRACVTCHQPNDAWTITPRDVQRRFFSSNGQDPIFAPIDGANCVDSDNHSLLLSRGLIRIFLPYLPETAKGFVPQFEVTLIDDPYNCQLSDAAAQQACEDSNGAGVQCLSVYRRPLPATNLIFLSTTMWDGREPNPKSGLQASLFSQATDATLGHAQATTSPTTAQLTQIFDFETGLFSAQLFDFRAGPLTADGAEGGPQEVSEQPFFIGINDVFMPRFNPVVFTLFDAWEKGGDDFFGREARESIARGEGIFNTRTVHITNVAGLNAGGPEIDGTCTTCHDTPNVGNHSVALPLDIGTSDPANTVLHPGSYLPIFHLKCIAGPLINQTFDTTDLGRGLITGQCADISKVKGPILHALAARAPYFHNGSAATLSQLVDFYDQRFTIGLSAQYKADLIAFLNAL